MFIPMAAVTILIANIYNKNYNHDIFILMNQSLQTLSRNLNTYLTELDQTSLMPYYNNSFIIAISKINQKPNGPDTLDKIEIEKAVGNMLTFSQYTRNDILGTLIVSNKQAVFNSTRLINCSIDPTYDFSKEAWYQEAVKANGKAIFIPPHLLKYYMADNSNYVRPKVISVVRSIVNIKTRKSQCVIKIDASMDSFENIYKNLEWHVPSFFIITDNENNLIYSNTETDPNAISNLSASEKEITYMNQKWFVYHSNENSYNWNVYVLLSKTAIHAKSLYIYVIAILFYILGLIFATVIYFMYSKRMVETVNTINQMTEEIKQGNINHNYTFSKNNELQLMIDSITYITSLLEEKIQQEYQLKIEQKEFQFKALQAQINPHFLFNTLGSLIALNQIGQNDKLGKSLFSLTSMLRYTLSSTNESSVEQELRFINDYCALQKLRFQNKLNYNINYEKSTALYSMPKLLLQPLVENSIIHGIEPQRKNCYLNVDIIDYKNNFILITIEDDGIGFEINSYQSHIGLSNVEKRLKLLNPQNTMSIESAPNMGTVITLTLEVNKNEFPNS